MRSENTFILLLTVVVISLLGKFWAIESLIGFWDGYTQNQNNYFDYENPKNGKIYFMPWGADGCFGDSPPFGGFGR